MKFKNWILPVFLVVLLAVFLNIVLWLNPREELAQDEEIGIPRIEIDLIDTDLTEVNEGSKTTVYGDNNLVIKVNGEEQSFSDVDIRGRGNSTWTQPKKPYQIRFKDKVDLFGMGKARKWVFLADYLDASHLRNDAAFYLENMLGEEYAKQGKFVDLSIDGAELGLYYVTSQVEVGKNSVDLRDPGGIIVELDNLHGPLEGCYLSDDDMCLTIQDVADSDYEKEAMTDFMNIFNALVSAARKGDYEKVSKLIDTESFAIYFLLSEYTVDPDAYTTSWFLYKDGADDKIHAGPGWDYDLALGNREWVWTDDKSFHSPFEIMVRRSEVFSDNQTGDMKTSKLVYYLVDMPEFMNKVRQIYNDRMSGRWGELLAHLTMTASKIWDKAEQDNTAWERKSYLKEVDYLTDWMKKRYQHFEKTYGIKNTSVPDFQ